MADPADSEIRRLEHAVRELRITLEKTEADAPARAKDSAGADRGKRDVSPFVLTILGAIGTGILAISNSFFQAKQAHDLEQDKLRSTLILKAIESPDREERKKALAFYVEAGLLSDPDGKIGRIKAENIPQAPESKSGFQKIGHSDIKAVGNAIVFSAGMMIDPLGAARAYHPDNSSGLDYLVNAGKPGSWWALVTDDGRPSGNPIIQKDSDPAPGFYISTTSLEDGSRDRTDPRRYVDSATVPYIVLPGRFNHGKLGDLAAVCREDTGKVAFAVVADVGPANKIGEGSIALAERLGIPSNAKNGGIDHGITYIVFPNSGEHWPMTVEEINQAGAKLFKDWGGPERLKSETREKENGS